MTIAPELKPTHHARRRTAHAPRPLPVWLQVGVVVLLLVQGVQTAAHWYHDATSQASSVTATQASPETRFEYYYTPDRLPSAAPQARTAYDPYGHAAANMQSSFQYSATYFHAPGALSVTRMTAYAPTAGRWVERDPLPAK